MTFFNALDLAGKALDIDRAWTWGYAQLTYGIAARRLLYGHIPVERGRTLQALALFLWNPTTLLG